MRTHQTVERFVELVEAGQGSAASSITGATRLLALIGDPVIQAKTPEMANRFLDKARVPGYVLVPMHVAADDLAEFVQALRCLRNFHGAVVTMPHKIRMAALVDSLTPRAMEVGAVNVIRRDELGRLEGTILDGEGFVAGLLSDGHAVDARRFLLSGTGGAGAAIAFSLLSHGCRELHLTNRTEQKALDMAERLRAAFPRAVVSTGKPGGRFDIAVNATRLGMVAGDDLPISADAIERSDLIAECVVAPEMTRLLQVAVTMGKRVHTGAAMLRSQLTLMLQFMGAIPDFK